MKISEIILNYRQLEGLSQRQFAARCGVSNAQISMIENNKNPKTGLPIAPTIPMVRKIAEGMGMTFDELIALADDFTVDVHSKKAELRSVRWSAETVVLANMIEQLDGRDKIKLEGVIEEMLRNEKYITAANEA